MRPTAAIVGLGELAMGRHPEVGSLRLHALAAESAIADAGIEKQKVDGVLTAGSRTEPYLVHSVALSESLGLRPGLSATFDLGGAAHASMVNYAAMAIANGMAKNVLVVSADNTLSAFSTGGVVKILAEVGPPHPAYERPFGPTVPSLYALIAQRYMHEFGLTEEELARLCVLQRENALLHDNAYMKKALSMEEALGARMIASPLRLFDCAPVCDGAGALLITSLEDAREIAQPVIAVLGAGESHDFHHVSFAPSWTSFGGGRAVRKALAQAGIELSDIDVAQIYDCFSITLLITLADIGFFPHGGASSYLRSGAMALGGSCPVNTHGGLLSHGHPGRAGGLFHLIEAVRQLRGNAGRRQVSDAELALVHGTGGVLAQHAALVLGRM